MLLAETRCWHSLFVFLETSATSSVMLDRISQKENAGWEVAARSGEVSWRDSKGQHSDLELR
ncbi:MAG: hypothetical protein ACKERG_01235 [Candidatus Hodgkinia cicadicola]